MRPRNALLLTFTLLALSAMPSGAEPPDPEPWGTLQGQVVWTEKAIPTNSPIPFVRPGLGPLLKDTLVVNAKNRGVRWVLVWLADSKDAGNAKFVPPIHPSLTNPPAAVVIDSPRGAFEPRVLGLWAKQSLIVKNSGTVAYDFRLYSTGDGPEHHTLIEPNKQATVKGFVPKPIPTQCSSNIRSWMKGYVGTFAHLYFAVTDADGRFEMKKAPVGKFQFVVWHEEVGFLTMTSKKDRGKVVEIRAEGVTDVGKIGMKAPKVRPGSGE